MGAAGECCSPMIEFVVPDLSFVIEQSVLGCDHRMSPACSGVARFTAHR